MLTNLIESEYTKQLIVFRTKQVFPLPFFVDNNCCATGSSTLLYQTFYQNSLDIKTNRMIRWQADTLWQRTWEFQQPASPQKRDLAVCWALRRCHPPRPQDTGSRRGIQAPWDEAWLWVNWRTSNVWLSGWSGHHLCEWHQRVTSHRICWTSHHASSLLTIHPTNIQMVINLH